jgi:hypothetical protein
MVAIGLCVMAALLALRIGWPDLPALPGSGVVVHVGVWLIAAVFAVRAVGDFRYVGFFKKIRDSPSRGSIPWPIRRYAHALHC